MSNVQAEILDEMAIKEYLLPVSVCSCTVHKTVDSTNTDARRRVLDGAEAPLLILAEEQTCGRGRMGRSFYSPINSGLYMSLALSSDGYGSVVGATSAAAVAVMRAIKEVYGIQTKIKWVNDLYLGEKKVCGILAESFSHNSLFYTVIGIGINLFTADFPEELTDKAGSLMPTHSSKNALAAQICKNLLELIDKLPDKSFMEDYCKYSCVLGRKIEFIQNGESFFGLAESITDDGVLCVRLDNGEICSLASGEITIRNIRKA